MKSAEKNDSFVSQQQNVLIERPGPRRMPINDECKQKSHANQLLARRELRETIVNVTTMGLTLCRYTISLAVQFVQRAEIGFRRSYNNVWIRPHAVDHATTVLQPDMDFPLGSRLIR